MKLEELLSLKGEDSELCEKGDVYDYEVIGNVIGNDFFMRKPTTTSMNTRIYY